MFKPRALKVTRWDGVQSEPAATSSPSTTPRCTWTRQQALRKLEWGWEIWGVVFRPECLICELVEGYGTGRGLSYPLLSPCSPRGQKAGWCWGWGVRLVWGRPGVRSRSGDGAASSAGCCLFLSCECSEGCCVSPREATQMLSLNSTVLAGGKTRSLPLSQLKPKPAASASSPGASWGTAGPLRGRLGGVEQPGLCCFKSPGQAARISSPIWLLNLEVWEGRARVSAGREGADRKAQPQPSPSPSY